MQKGFSLADLIPEAPKIIIVHVGASILPDMPEPYAALVESGRAHAVCFEPNEAERKKLAAAMGPGYTVLPYFIGAGGPAVFHETNVPFTGSLLAPNPDVLNRFQNLGELTELRATHPVTTARLDDVLEITDVDYLKIDVQGAEIAAFSGGSRVLDACSLVETEVAFAELYKDQPLFADVDADLRGRGFQFHTLKNICGRYFKPMASGDSPSDTVNQLLWADAVYVRHMLAPDRLPTGKLLRLAILLHDAYGSIDLALEILRVVDTRTGGTLAKTYFDRLTG